MGHNKVPGISPNQQFLTTLKDNGPFRARKRLSPGRPMYGNGEVDYFFRLAASAMARSIRRVARC